MIPSSISCWADGMEEDDWRSILREAGEGGEKNDVFSFFFWLEFDFVFVDAESEAVGRGGRGTLDAIGEDREEEE